MVRLLAHDNGSHRPMEVRRRSVVPVAAGADLASLASAASLMPRHLQAAQRLLQAQESVLAPTQLTATQFVVLAEIEAREPAMLDPDELAVTLLLDESVLRRALRELGRNRCVRLVARSDEWPSGRVELTAEGRARLRHAHPLWERARIRLAATLGEPAAAALRNLVTLFASLETAATLDFKTPIA